MSSSDSEEEVCGPNPKSRKCFVRTRSRVTELSYRWVINDVSASIPSQLPIQSPEFGLEGGPSEWYLELCANEVEEGFLQLCLVRASQTSAIAAFHASVYGRSMMGQKRRININVDDSFDNYEPFESITYPKFLKTCDIQSSENRNRFVDQNALTILCQVMTMHDTKKVYLQNPNYLLSKDLGRMQFFGDFSDASLVA